MIINIERGPMEKEKLKDKITKIFDNFSVEGLLLTLFFLMDLFFKQASILCLLVVMFFISKINIKHKYSNIISLFYTVIPTFCHVYILNKNVGFDFILWIYLLLFSVKITMYMFNNVFDDITNTKNYSLFGLVGSLLVSLLIGIVSSLFLKQKFFIFVSLNIFIALSIYLQSFFKNKLSDYIENDNKITSIFYDLHNNFIFIFLILTFYITL